MHKFCRLPRLLFCLLWFGAFVRSEIALTEVARAESPVSYTEKVIQIGEMWAAEIEIENSPVPTESKVLFVHGWTGNMDEVGDLFKRLAAQLAERGIPSLRISFRGESERELTNFRLTSTFASRVADAESGFAYLQEKYPEQKLGVVGFSLGGATVLALTGNHPDQIDSLLLWSSLGNPDLMFSDLTSEQRQQVMEDGETTLALWEDFIVTKQHMLGFQGYDLFPALGAYKGAVFSIRGTQDYVPPQEESIFAATSAQPEKAWLMEGADHIFNVLDPESTYDEALIEASLDWFIETLD